MRVLRTRLQKFAYLLVGSACSIHGCGVVRVRSVRAMVDMLVLMLPLNVQRRVLIAHDTGRRRAVVRGISHCSWQGNSWKS
jgi:hypothetical protein